MEKGCEMENTFFFFSFNGGGFFFGSQGEAVGVGSKWGNGGGTEGGSVEGKGVQTPITST